MKNPTSCEAGFFSFYFSCNIVNFIVYLCCMNIMGCGEMLKNWLKMARSNQLIRHRNSDIQDYFAIGDF